MWAACTLLFLIRCDCCGHATGWPSDGPQRICCRHTGQDLLSMLLRVLSTAVVGSPVGRAGPQHGWMQLATAEAVGTPKYRASSLHSQQRGPAPRTVGMLVCRVISASCPQGRSRLGGAPVLTSVACWVWWVCRGTPGWAQGPSKVDGKH